MKKQQILIVLFSLIGLYSRAQVASRIIVTQAFPTDSASVETYMYPDNRTVPSNQMNRWRVGYQKNMTFQSSQITNALGYTPYSATNPNGYIASYTETDPLFNTKFAAKSTTDLTEGTRLYYTDGRARTALSVSGAGISYNSASGQFTNTAPNQVVGLTGANGITITGLYPNFTITQASGVVYTPGSGIGIVGSVISNASPDQTVSITSGNTTYLTASGTYPNFTITPYVPAISVSVTRPINSTTFTISTTKQATVYYTVNVSCTATIGSTATGKVSLQYSQNAGSTWIDVSDVSNSNAVTLAIVLNSVNAQDQVISGPVPANALCRLVSASTGTTTITYVRGTEVY